MSNRNNATEYRFPLTNGDAVLTIPGDLGDGDDEFLVAWLDLIQRHANARIEAQREFEQSPDIIHMEHPT